MCFLNNVLFFSCAVILSLRGLSAVGDGEPVTAEEMARAEKHADELMLDGRLAVWELLENENARKTIRAFFEEVKLIHEDDTSAYMMVGVTQQIKDTLTNENQGAESVRHIVTAIRDCSINPSYANTIEALYKSTYRTIVDPYTPKWMNKIFDFLEACVQTHRGDELVLALTNGICDIVEKPNTRENIIKAFQNGKQLISTSMKRKVTNFFTHG